VSFDVCHLSRSKSNVIDDPLNKKQKCNESKPRKKSYDNTKKIQIEWAVKVPWAEGVISKDGMIILVKNCSMVEKKGKIMGCKWDTLIKHQACQIVL
jgi:hypothetical protein